MTSKAQQRAWRDWGTVNPMFGIVTDARYRHGGDTEEFFSSGESAVESVLAHVADAGISLRKASALDFGCGIGRLTFPLGRLFDEVVGVDASKTMLERAAELHPPVANCRFVLNEDDDLRRFPDGSFDLVVSWAVLQHLDSTQTIERFLGEFVRVLRPGGAVVFQLPTAVPAHRRPLPPWHTRSGLRARWPIVLRRIGVSPEFLYRHFDWVPQMTMLAIPEQRVRSVVEDAGGAVVLVSPSVVDGGGTTHQSYVATR